MPKIKFCYLFCLLMILPVAQATDVRLQVEGLSGNLKKNVEARLSTINQNDISADIRSRSQISEVIGEGLRALGYYEPTITFQLTPPPFAAMRSVLHAKVDPGLPVKIANTEVILRGGARQDSDFLALIADGVPKPGTILNHGTYDDFKKSLNDISLSKGYFDADYHKSELGVSVVRRQAFWDIDYDSGERYRFGPVKFEGSQIDLHYLENLVPFQQGNYYSSAQLAELNRRLSATGWFNSVVASPDFESARQSKLLPITTILTPHAKNTIETGVGYSTDIGPKLKASWKRPWVNSQGHSFTTSTILSKYEPQLDFSYKIPLLESPLEQFYLFQTGLKRADVNDTRESASSVSASRYWQFSDDWQRGLNLSWKLVHFTQGGVTNTTMLVYPGVSINRTRSRGGLMPEWGDSQRYSVDVSNTDWGSDIDFVIFQAQNAWVRTLAEKHRFLMRANMGWIDSNSFNRIPPSLRFFAGGDRSIRGYKYKSISPRDGKGKLTGASRLVTGSLEYQYNFSGKWWGAMFIDSGEAVNDIRNGDFKTGVGVGVRWQSPVGPVKFDIARPIGDSSRRRMQFYIGLGSEL